MFSLTFSIIQCVVVGAVSIHFDMGKQIFDGAVAAVVVILPRQIFFYAVVGMGKDYVIEFCSVAPDNGPAGEVVYPARM